MKGASRWCKERLSSIRRNAPLQKGRGVSFFFFFFFITIRVTMLLCLNNMSLKQYVFMSFCLKNTSLKQYVAMSFCLKKHVLLS